MNIQTERLDNHTARFTVELDAERLEAAKQKAARNLARRVVVPGFRKGKVPYRILLSYVGEQAVLEDAVEILGNEIYKEALDQSGVEPYGPGALENFSIEPSPTFVFVVPLQPVVKLGEYRALRRVFEVPAVEDDDVDRSMKLLQEQNALVEESHKPLAMGNRVTMDIHAELVGAPEAEAESSEGGDAADEQDEHAHSSLIHEHDATMILAEDREEPAPGFRQALIGAVVGENREFELTYPDDEATYGPDLAGKTARFHVGIKKIETITLPALNDDFAARVTANEEKQLTLLELRMRIRENLQRAKEQNAKAEYARAVLDEIVAQADISYPDDLVFDQTEEYLERVDRDLRQRGLTLDDYMRITSKSRDDLHQDYRETTVQSLERSLVLREVMRAEQIVVTEAEIEEEIDRIIAQFGEQAASVRSMFKTPSMRENVKNDLLEQRVLDRIVAIARGEAPELSAPPAQAQESSENQPEEGANS